LIVPQPAGADPADGRPEGRGGYFEVRPGTRPRMNDWASLFQRFAKYDVPLLQ
jgi:hypothetical protein